MTSQTFPDPSANVNGTALVGEIDISYAELVQALGVPHSDGDAYKVDAEWVFQTAAGVATLYNYKSGPNYGEGPLEDVRDWHIGGKSADVVPYVTDFIAKRVAEAQTSSQEATEAPQAKSEYTHTLIVPVSEGYQRPIVVKEPVGFITDYSLLDEHDFLHLTDTEDRPVIFNIENVAAMTGIKADEVDEVVRSFRDE